MDTLDEEHVEEDKDEHDDGTSIIDVVPSLLLTTYTPSFPWRPHPNRSHVDTNAAEGALSMLSPWTCDSQPGMTLGHLYCHAALADNAAFTDSDKKTNGVLL